MKPISLFKDFSSTLSHVRLKTLNFPGDSQKIKFEGFARVPWVVIVVEQAISLSVNVALRSFKGDTQGSGKCLDPVETFYLNCCGKFPANRGARIPHGHRNNVTCSCRDSHFLELTLTFIHHGFQQLCSHITVKDTRQGKSLNQSTQCNK